ncbi:MAG: hypothetical protein KIG65_00125 [Eubacteriales bacterium]|nr:hypothetical protein [Eubacteriales bacterium]
MENEQRVNELSTESIESFANEISVLDILVLVMRNWWIVGLVGLVLAVACYAYSKSTAVPTYKSTGNLYIDTQRERIDDDVNATALLYARDLMPTYIEILESRTFNTMISEAMNNKYTYQEIDAMTALSQVEDTNIMEINVVCVDERDSYLICDYIVRFAADEILRVFEGGSVKVIDSPEQSPKIIVVNLFKRGIIGFVIGAILAIIAIVLFDMFDTRIVTTEELTTRYKLPVLGEISNLSDMS